MSLRAPGLRRGPLLRRLVPSLLVLSLLVLLGCKKKAPEFTPEQIYWPPPPEVPVYKWEGHIATSRWAERPGAIKRFLIQLVGARDLVHFKKPYAVAVDPSGRVLVTDTGWGSVLVFDRPHKRFQFLGNKGQGALQKPTGVTTDAQGHIFVGDAKLARVFEYDENLEFVRTYGGGLLARPVGVLVVPDRNELWVVDTGRHVIEVFGVGGDHVRTIGSRGPEPGQFNFPTNLAMNSKGEIYVVDTFNFRVQVFDEDGNYLRHWGKNCDSFGCFARPKGIAVDADDNVYVVDAAFSNVQVFDGEGRLLVFFGGVGNGPGQLWLPAGMTITPEGDVFVVSQYNWRVNWYRYLGPPEGREPPTSAETDAGRSG